MPNRFPLTGMLAPTPAPHAVVEALLREGLEVSIVDADRAEHGRDWWPRTIPEVAAGEVPSWPGAVLRPRSSAQVATALRVALEHRVPVTAQGGRSGVVGGALVAPGGLALDLTGLNRVIELDPTAQVVRVEAGVFGPDLESFARSHGLTLGHFPQSFELSTVGGWIACRGAGQYSNRYGTIEDLVRGLTVVLVGGEVIEFGGHGPHAAEGPDLTRLFLGAEGTLGVVTEATLVLRRAPAHEASTAYRFDDFEAGMTACRRVLQRDVHPAVLRLYDEVESKRSFDVEGCALIVLDEGESDFVRAQIAVVREECADATPLEPWLVERWLERRNDVSQLAPLWEGGLVVDTIEVAGPWSALPALRERVLSGLRGLEGMIAASVHQSHAYVDGACLYFTFAGRPAGDADEFYRAAWDRAMAVALDLRVAISHHHGVGRNRARFLPASLGPAYSILEGLKAQLDPEGLLNPGVLGLGGSAW